MRYAVSAKAAAASTLSALCTSTTRAAISGSINGYAESYADLAYTQGNADVSICTAAVSSSTTCSTSAACASTAHSGAAYGRIF
jgi:hypothetical protein